MPNTVRHFSDAGNKGSDMMNSTAVLVALLIGVGSALGGCQASGDRRPAATIDAGKATASRKQPDCARADSMDPLCRTTSCVAIEGNFCDL